MRIILTLLFSITISLGFAQTPWKAISESQIEPNGTERLTIPNAYHTFSLDIDQLSSKLAMAPMEDILDSKKAGIRVELPLADGKLHMFDFVESPCMSPVLSAKYPHIRSYRGVSLDGNNSPARIDISNQGFRGAINGPEGTIYIDPYFSKADGNYISYYVVDHVVELDELARTCNVQDYEERIREQTLLRNGKKKPISRSGGDVVIKTTYRFALACTGEWGSSKGSTVDEVLSIMVSGVNRLNSLLEDEVAIKFELIDNNDKLIFFSNTEQYSNPNNGGQTLSENTDVLNRYVGADSYDVGHVFTVRCTEDSVGGIASGSSACTDNKGNGVSCVGNRNIDNFMVTTTAHEIGHQFSAGHTFNNCPGEQTEAQFAFSSSCEPGSGATILSYLGACGNSQNLSGRDINLYHVCTLDQITNFVANAGGSRCGSHLPSDNHHPEVWIDQPGGFYIPIVTPFELTGDASDMDGDVLVYSWEQVDIDFPATVGAPRGNSPLFRVWEPVTSKTRVFPRLPNILSGNDWSEEKLPTYDRDLTFNFVVRDDNRLAGGVNWATIGFKSTNTAGPFLVTEPGTFISSEPGKTMIVEWNVANTDNDLVNCQYVDIYFSDDEAQSFPYLLRERTPNDGSEVIIIPDAVTQTGKVKVKANNSVFFNINRGDIRIVEPSQPGFLVDNDTKAFDTCLPATLETVIQGTSFMGFSEMIDLEIISGLPDNAIATFSQNPMPVDGSSTLSLDFSQVLASGLSDIVVRATAPGADTLDLHVSVDAKSSYLDDFALIAPNSGIGSVNTVPDFSWSSSPNATGYRFELASNPSFDVSNILLQEEMGLATSISAQINIENNTLYYWRVIAYNQCLGEASSEIHTFHTVALSCSEQVAVDLPLNIPSSGTPTIESKISVESTGLVTDVNVGVIRGNHKELLSLRGTLVSPAGTSVVLWQGGCLNEETIYTGFDDSAAFDNGCPNTNGQSMKPRNPLAKLIGEPVNGDWILKIEDTESGNGGSISEFSLSICSDEVLESPYIVNNEVLLVGTGKGNYIQPEELLVEDGNNTAEELIFTIVELPTKGQLEIGSSALRIGAKFTQDQISNNRLVYKHNGTVEEEDSFVFTVIDGEGGWIEKTRFIISAADGNPASSISDIETADNHFDIYPNPTKNLIYVDEKTPSKNKWSLQLMTVDGQLLSTDSFVNNTKLDLDNQVAGMYLLKLSDGEHILTKKVIVTK